MVIPKDGRKMISARKILKIHRHDGKIPVAAPKSRSQCWARLKNKVVERIKRSRRRYTTPKITKLSRRTPVDPETEPLLDQTENFEAVGELHERHPQSEPTSLYELSSEILHTITSFLPTSSSAALCLVSRTMLWKLGTSFFRELNKEVPKTVETFSYHMIDPPVMTPGQQQYEEFLLLLDRDSMDFIYCYYCKKLHCPSRTKSTSSNPDSLLNPCSVVARLYATYPYLHDLHFGQVQMAMKHHRLGLDTRAQLAEMSRTKITKETQKDNEYTWKTSTLARIRKGRLLLRSQHTLTFPARPLPLLPRYWDFALCAHFISRCPRMADPFRALDKYLQCRVSHSEDSDSECERSCSCSAWEFPSRCQGCGTEFQFQRSGMKKGDGEVGVGVVVWQDFGDGVSPFENGWESHGRVDAMRSPSFRVGSIRHDFEEGCDNFHAI